MRVCMKILVTALFFSILSSAGADVTLTADGNSGRDNCWVKRYDAGVNCWGIQGTGSSLNGSIWWNSFPGGSGTYKIALGAVLEPDGNSPYAFYIAESKKTSGNYPYSTGSLNCGSSTLKVADINLGEHYVANGAKIRYWAKSVYPCGSSHGQYSRFYQIKFVPVSVTPLPPALQLDKTSLTFTANAGYTAFPSAQVVKATNTGGGTLPALTATTTSAVDWLKLTVSGSGNAQEIKNEIIKPGLTANSYSATVAIKGSGLTDKTYTVLFTVKSAGTVAPPTTMTAPAEGTKLEEGKQYVLTATGESLHWSYDANSDGLGAADIGQGSSVSFTVPTGVTSPRTIVITVSGSNGTVNRTFDIVAPEARQLVTLLAPNGGETARVGDTLWVRWEADTNVVTDVVLRLSTDNGLDWGRIITTTSAVSLTDKELWGRFPFVPSDDMVSTKCRIRVEKYESTDPLEQDISDAVFSIVKNPASASRSLSARGISITSPVFLRGGVLRVPHADMVEIVTTSGSRVCRARAVDGVCTVGRLQPGRYMVIAFRGGVREVATFAVTR